MILKSWFIIKSKNWKTEKKILLDPFGDVIQEFSLTQTPWRSLACCKEKKGSEDFSQNMVVFYSILQCHLLRWLVPSNQNIFRKPICSLLKMKVLSFRESVCLLFCENRCSFARSCAILFFLFLFIFCFFCKLVCDPIRRLKKIDNNEYPSN